MRVRALSELLCKVNFFSIKVAGGATAGATTTNDALLETQPAKL